MRELFKKYFSAVLFVLPYIFLEILSFSLNVIFIFNCLLAENMQDFV